MSKNGHDDLLAKLKSSIKLELIKHYDITKSDIDIIAQELLLPQNNLTATCREQILRINKLIINKVDVIFDENLNEIDDFISNIENKNANESIQSENLNEEFIKINALKSSYCIFISKDKLKDEFKKLVNLGILIITDWYLNENQVNFIRFLIEQDLDALAGKKFKYDENILNLKHVLNTRNNSIHNIQNKFDDDILMIKKSEIINELNSLERYNLYFEHEVENLEYITVNTFKNLANIKQFFLQLTLFERNENQDTTNTFNIFSCLTNLEALHLFDFDYFDEDKINEINVIDYLKHLVKLKRLYLNNCLIKSVPENGFQYMIDLNELELAYNYIENLSSNIFFGLTNLEKLDISNNSLIQIEENTFKHLVNLKYLNLSNNNLKNLNQMAFNEGLSKLETLLMNNCHINRIEIGLFAKLANLKQLSLSSNKLDSLKAKMFTGLVNLSFLDLSRCKIETIENESFADLFNLETLSVFGNVIEINDFNEFKKLHPSLVKLNENNFNKYKIWSIL